jgi:hypothetical protein
VSVLEALAVLPLVLLPLVLLPLLPLTVAAAVVELLALLTLLAHDHWWQVAWS